MEKFEKRGRGSVLSMYVRVVVMYFGLDDSLFAVHAQVHLARIEVML